MYRILTLMFILLVPGSVAMFATEGEADYQIAWTTGNGTVYGAVFKATPEEASKRLDWANRFDSSTTHWLVARGAAVGAAPRCAAGAAAGALAMDGRGGALDAPVGPPGGSVGNLMVGAAEGFGGKLMRTVSFLG